MKVLITQRGARHRYMIPRILNDAGILECLYTDSHNKSFIGRVGNVLSKFGVRSPQLTRLMKREIPLPPSKVKSSDLLFWKQLSGRFRHSSIVDSIRLNYECNDATFKRWGIGNADCLYTMFIDNLAFVEYAKSKGLYVIADIYENPYIFNELVLEIDRNPEYACVDYLKTQYSAYGAIRMQRFDRLLALADSYTVPSEYVHKCIKRSCNFDERKVCVIPYPSSISTISNPNRPVKGRIIWVGNDSVRKGLVYCQRVAKELKKWYGDIDFRIIGQVEPEIRNSPSFRDLNFIGKLNKAELEAELKVADMYVFPTLAEGFAGTVIEAASYGVPIITTENSGCGQDFPARFVPERNHDAIVTEVSCLLENRVERDALSRKTFAYTQKLSKEAYSKNLLALMSYVENHKQMA